MKILFCGDVMPGGVLPYQTQYINQHLLSFLKFRVGVKVKHKVSKLVRGIVK